MILGGYVLQHRNVQLQRAKIVGETSHCRHWAVRVVTTSTGLLHRTVRAESRQNQGGVRSDCHTYLP